MPATTAPAPLHRTLIDGLPVKERADGSVITIHSAQGGTVAEVCVGKSKTRVNFRSAPTKLPKNLVLDGRSKSWACGANLSADNLAGLRTVLVAVVGKAADKAAGRPTRSSTASADAAAVKAAGRVRPRAKAAGKAALAAAAAGAQGDQG